MRALVTALVSVAMALAALGLAVAAPHRGQPAPKSALGDASGALRITNSRAGEAVFDAAAMRPGQGVSGSVRIGNAGDVPGNFSVLLTDVQDTPGPYGGRLSERMQLALVDVTDAQRPVTVYAGTQADFGAIELGTIAPGAERDYHLAAALPDGGLPGTAAAGDNRFQGSALSLGLEWRASAAGDASAPTTPPGSTAGVVPPQPPAAKAPAPVPATPPAAAPHGAGEVLGLPLGKACVKRHRLTVRLKAPGGARVLSATVNVNGKVKARVNGAKKRVRVKLRGLPSGRVRIVVSVRASNGRSYTSTRSYSTCKRKKPKRTRR